MFARQGAAIVRPIWRCSNVPIRHSSECLVFKKWRAALRSDQIAPLMIDRASESFGLKADLATTHLFLVKARR